MRFADARVVIERDAAVDGLRLVGDGAAAHAYVTVHGAQCSIGLAIVGAHRRIHRGDVVAVGSRVRNWTTGPGQPHDDEGGDASERFHGLSPGWPKWLLSVLTSGLAARLQSKKNPAEGGVYWSLACLLVCGGVFSALLVVIRCGLCRAACPRKEQAVCQRILTSSRWSNRVTGGSVKAMCQFGQYVTSTCEGQLSKSSTHGRRSGAT